MLFAIKENAREPAIKVRASTWGNENLDLTGATVVFTMRNRATGVNKIDEQVCVITAALTGDFEYRWAAGDTDTIGEYDGEFKITLGSGKVLIVPTHDYVIVRVVDALA